MFSRFVNFLGDSREELKRVIWPSRANTVSMVLVVIAISVVVAAFLGALDYIFLKALENLLQ